MAMCLIDFVIYRICHIRPSTNFWNFYRNLKLHFINLNKVFDLIGVFSTEQNFLQKLSSGDKNIAKFLIEMNELFKLHFVKIDGI